MTIRVGKNIRGINEVGRKFWLLHANYRWLIVFWPLFALLLAIAGWSAVSSALASKWQQAEAGALQQAAALSRSYAEQLARTLESVDQIALHVKYEWELSNGQLQLEKAAQRGLFPSTAIFYVAIVGRNGFPLTDTLPNAEKVFLGDRQYFQVQKAATTDFLYVGESARGRISKRDTVLFSRRLLDQNGDFYGVVVVSVAPEYFTVNYDATTLGQHGLMGMIGNDRIVRVLRTGEQLQKPGANTLLSVPLLTSSSGSLLLSGKQWFADQRARYVGWQAVKGYPIVALVGLDQKDVLAPYWTIRTSYLAYAIAWSIALGCLALIAMIVSMRFGWRKHQLEMTRTTYRRATEEGSEGFYIARPIRSEDGEIVDFETIDCNARGAQIFRQQRAQLIGKRVSRLYEGTNLDVLMARLRQAMETGFYEGEFEVRLAGRATGCWLYLKIVRSHGDLAVTARDISAARAHVEELERRGNEDGLTGLPNRHWVHAYLPPVLECAAVNNSMLALLYVDLDGLKSVNDTMGHAAGDELLRNAASRLKIAVRPPNHVVRLGSDEFVAILEPLAQKNDAANVAERVLRAFQESFIIPQGVYSVGASIGISVFPVDGTDTDTLLQNAEIAMYSVKTSGKGSYRFYEQSLFETLRARRVKERDLRDAIKHDQFVMYYQPRIDIATGAISSMEALVRWQHPVKGLLEPLEFIELAEETGLILALGELVVDKVCAQLADWARNSGQLVPVSVNVSPRQFNEADIGRIFSESLARHQIDPALVEIELTESSMMGDTSEVSSSLAAIQQMGIKLLIDDFGTGYSSLSQLQRLDFDVLKVDRAFTAELGKGDEGNVFFKAIITMAHALGMRVVAEGVETERQLLILASLRCDEIQGFFVSRPLPATDRQPVLENWFAALAP